MWKGAKQNVSVLQKIFKRLCIWPNAFWTVLLLAFGRYGCQEWVQCRVRVSVGAGLWSHSQVQSQWRWRNGQRLKMLPHQDLHGLGFGSLLWPHRAACPCHGAMGGRLQLAKRDRWPILRETLFRCSGFSLKINPPLSPRSFMFILEGRKVLNQLKRA